MCWSLGMASVQPFWWTVQEQEITLKVWECAAPDVDTWRGWELKRLFGLVCGTADMAKMLENQTRMIADKVGRVEAAILLSWMCCHLAHLGTRRTPLKRCHTLRARRVPDSHPRPSFASLWHFGSLRKRQVQQGLKLAPISPGAVHDGRQAASLCMRRQTGSWPCVIVVAMMQSACTWQNACSKRSTISETPRQPSWP